MDELPLFNLGLMTAATIQQAYLDFVNKHRTQQGMEGNFHITAAYAPSDLPSNIDMWRYSFGKFVVRVADSRGISDGIIILYGFGLPAVAYKSVANNTFSSWKIFS